MLNSCNSVFLPTRPHTPTRYLRHRPTTTKLTTCARSSWTLPASDLHATPLECRFGTLGSWYHSFLPSMTTSFANNSSLRISPAMLSSAFETHLPLKGHQPTLTGANCDDTAVITATTNHKRKIGGIETATQTQNTKKQHAFLEP